MSDLRECPFCGSDKKLSIFYDIDGDFVICRNCCSSGPAGLEAWNTRAADARIAELEAGLAAVVEEYDDTPAGITLHSIRAHALPALKGEGE